MKNFVATNNSSLGAIQNCLADLKHRYGGSELFVLVEENKAEAYGKILEGCKIISYRQGSLFSSGGMYRFYRELRAHEFEQFTVIKEKEKNMTPNTISCFTFPGPGVNCSTMPWTGISMKRAGPISFLR